MGHGCHNCGCPNGCECEPVERLPNYAWLEEQQLRMLDDKAQRILESADRWFSKISALERNKNVPAQTLLNRALVLAIMDVK